MITRKQKQRMVLGIDPGLDGGLVLLGENSEMFEKWVIPCFTSYSTKKNSKTGKETKSTKRSLDLVSLNKIFEIAKPMATHAVLEQVASRPGMSAPAVFKFGRVYGTLEGLLVAHRIPYTLCIPRVWTKVIHAGIEGGLEPKDKSLIALGRLFPTVNLRATDRSVKPHEGLMDALLIAEWGRRVLFYGTPQADHGQAEDRDAEEEAEDE